MHADHECKPVSRILVLIVDSAPNWDRKCFLALCSKNSSTVIDLSISKSLKLHHTADGLRIFLTTVTLVLLNNLVVDTVSLAEIRFSRFRRLNFFFEVLSRFVSKKIYILQE